MTDNRGDFGYGRMVLGNVILFEFPSTPENDAARARFDEILAVAKFGEQVDGCGSFKYENEDSFCLFAFMKHTKCDCAGMMGKFAHFRNYVDNAGFKFDPKPLEYKADALPEELCRLIEDSARA